MTAQSASFHRVKQGISRGEMTQMTTRRKGKEKLIYIISHHYAPKTSALSFMPHIV